MRDNKLTMNNFFQYFGRGVLIGLGLGMLYNTPAQARLLQTCMDKHGSTYSAEICDGRDVTPEYMYTDRETQRLQMILNQYSAQALMGIAANGATRITSVDNSSMNNSQGQGQSSAINNSVRSSNNNTSDSTSVSGSSSVANATARNNNDNTNVNNNFNGVWR